MRSNPLRIAYINQDFPPEVGAGPARILEMSQRWREAGVEVTVITGMPNRRMAGLDDGEIHPDYQGRLFVREEREGIRVLRSWLYSSPERGFGRTLLNNASFMATSIGHALARSGDLDVVIASSPPFLAHVTGDVLRRVRRVPLVLEIRDLWPDYLVEMGLVNGRLPRRLLFGLERFLLRRAQRVVVVTDSFRRRIQDKGVPGERIDVIPNGVPLDRYYREPDPEPVLPEMVRRDGEFIVGYLGNFGAGQELRTVVEAAALVRDRAPEIRFVLVGDGREKPNVERRAAELDVTNLSIHPPIEKERTRAFYNGCDLCLVPLAPVPIFSETVPSKLFEILACERPVLASVAGEAARIVAASAGGIVTEPGDARALADGVLRMKEAPDRAAMGRAGRRHVAEHFSRDRLALRYLQVLEGVTGQGRGPAPCVRAGTEP